MPSTYVQTRYGANTYKLAPVLASYRHASGHVFLVHRTPDAANGFTTTYGPTGYGAGSHDTLDAAIARIESMSPERVTKAITDCLATMDTLYMALLSGENGLKHSQVWRKVQRSRFDSGEYRAVPQLDALGDLAYPPGHYLHLSVTNDAQDFVAYTPSASHGEQDRQVRLRFGKYLRKAFPNLSDATVQAAVTELRAKLARTCETLHFAMDVPTINDIFETRMSAQDNGGEYASCMWNKWHNDDIRPYHVYAGSPDVAVAYVRRGDDIIARSVVSTRNKRWVRLYAVDGEETLCALLKGMLTAQGYEHGDLEGNRLTKLPTRNIMLPYLDGDAQDVTSEGKYWRVSDRHGEYVANQTNGTVEDFSRRCERCGNDEDDCECSNCTCCGTSYYESCPTCNNCVHCGLCIRHDACTCTRCVDCNERLEDCECVRCGECNDFVDSCECEPKPEESTLGVSA